MRKRNVLCSRYRVALGVVVLLSLIPVRGASAECPDRPVRGSKAKRLAKSWHIKAAAYFRAKRYLHAMKAWQCSLSLYERAGTHYNIAKAADAAKRPGVALRHFLKYLETRPNAPQKSEIEKRILALKQMIQPPVRRVDPDETGRNPSRRTVALEVPRRGASITKPAQVRRTGRARWMRMGGWTGTAVGSFLILTGTILGGLAVKAKSSVENAADGTPWPDLESRYKSYDGLRAGAWATIATGSAVLVTGVTLLILHKVKKKKEKLRGSLVPTNRGTLLVLEGTF